MPSTARSGAGLPPDPPPPPYRRPRRTKAARPPEECANLADAINDASTGKVAIIGIGCRLPGGAGDHRAFWRNLLSGKDCLTPT
ncbi:beta-ketoacyl synthase N-terminal-like domain-containing protein, partial [Streptomyces albidoflavus]